MPLLLIAALAVSLGLHGLALWGTELNLAPGDAGGESPRLEATLRPPPQAHPAAPVASARPASGPVRPEAGKRPARLRPDPPALVPVVDGEARSAEAEAPGHVAAVAAAGAGAAGGPGFQGGGDFPPRGEIRFVVHRGEQGLEVGRAVHRWEMADGRYRLESVTETTGLAALFKPVRIETESRGWFDRQGLHPEQYRVMKNGSPTGESADFDWSGGQVRMGGQDWQPLRPGSQDLLSLHYQLAYLPALAEGVALGVVTGKRYDPFQFDALGEELLEMPAGRFRTLHLQHLGRNRTEIWLALDHLLLPVQIRHTDRKGDVFQLQAVSVNPAPPPSSSFLQRE
ncbi:DUF3108 domain-containing protein [Azovibrio restrictus]|uniref:DUF3108 domain-containing protein n=1 Tax=Azovibrio restrictus TaxID=146938 RepID=UPI0026F1036A|nr:DUF3108 domain-containing protein [Azovibrio restrictus]